MLSRWGREFLESVDEPEFDKGGLLDTATSDLDSSDKWDVLEQWQKLNAGNLKRQVLDNLPIFSEDGFADTDKLNVFSDTQSACHVRFKNGVVKITKDKIELIEPSRVKSLGAVWQSSIINRNIVLDSEPKGLFVKFATLAMLYHEDEVYTH